MKTNFRNPGLLKTASGLLRYAMVLVVALLLVNPGAFAQKKQPVYGRGGTVPVGVNGFEVDANFRSASRPAFVYASFYSPSPAPALFIPYYNNVDGDDWVAGLSKNGVIPKVNGAYVPNVLSSDGRTIWKIDGNSGNLSTIAEMDIFAGTSNKNSDFIAATQSPYSVKAASGGPQKNDITNVFVHTRVKNDSTWLFFAFETRSTDGTSYGDIEYNQAGVSLTHTLGKVIGLGADTAGGRTYGDFILSVDFSGGGTNPSVAARKLRAGGIWSDKIPVSAQNAFVTINIADVPAVVPNGGFNGNGSPSNTTFAYQLIEGGVNLTALNLDDNQCDPDATITFKTRSSDSFTAELKDLSTFKFSITPPATMEDIADVAICPTDTATFVADVAGDGAEGVNIKWYKWNSAAMPPAYQLLSNGGLGGRLSITYDDTSSTLQIINVIASDSGKYKAVLEGATCGMPYDSAYLTINTINPPYVTLTEPSICGPATGKLKVCDPVVGGNYYLIQLDPNDLTDSLYADSVKNYVSGLLEFSGLLPGAGFILRLEKGGCEAIINCDSTDYIVAAEACTASTARVTPPKTNPVQDHSFVQPQDDQRKADPKSEARPLTAYPVPFSDKVTLEFVSDKTEHYVISLYDINGRMIKELKSGKAKAGEVIKVEVNGKGMVDSMYYARKVSKSGAETLKLLKKE